MGGELGVFTAYVFFGVLVLSAGLIVWMMVSLVHSEVADERRRLIVGKACTWTLIATVGAEIAWFETGVTAAFPAAYAFNALTVGLGELAACYILGSILISVLPQVEPLRALMPKERLARS